MGRVVAIVGDARCKATDLELLDLLHKDYHVCCINRAGIWFPGFFEHWFSWHSNLLPEWAEERPGAQLHSTYQHDGVQLHSVKRPYGGSAMGAIQVMLECLGYSKAVLVGCPMDGEYRRFLDEWDQLYDLKHRIRSMGGNTKEYFGLPTKEWLENV